MKNKKFTLIEIMIVIGLMAFIGSISAYYLFAGKSEKETKIKDIYFSSAQRAILKVKDAVEKADSIMKIGEKSVTVMDTKGESVTYYLEDGKIYKRISEYDNKKTIIAKMIQDFSVKPMFPIPKKTYEITVVAGESKDNSRIPVILQTTIFRRKNK